VTTLEAPAPTVAPQIAAGERPSPQQLTRRRRAALGALGLIAAGLVAAVVLLASGSGVAPPATGAAAVVPADALAYLNVSTDRGRRTVERSMSLAKELPTYPIASMGIASWLGSAIGSSTPVDFATDIQPWLGKEAALAVLDTASSTAGTLFVLDVTDGAKARSFLTRVGAAPASSYRGTSLLRTPAGTTFAFNGHFLMFGQDASVRAALDVVAGAAPSLAKNSSYRAAIKGEPAGRVLDGYASAAGVQRVLASQTGAVGALGTLLSQPALQAASFSLSPARSGVAIQVHTTFDPALSRLRGSSSSFNPSLQKVIPPGSAVLLDVANLARVAPRVLSAGAAAGVAGGVGPLLSRLGSALKAEGVNVPSVLSLFDGETAVAIGGGASGASPGLIVVTRTAHQAQANAALASLEAPLAQLFAAPSAGPGTAPEFNDTTIDGVTAHRLGLSSGLQLDYAVFHGLVVFSTSLGALQSVIEHRGSVAGDPAYRAVAGPPKRVTSLLFLDLRQLLSLGEQMGLTHSAALQALMPDLDRIRAVGMSSTGGEDDSTAELTLQFQ
jgi:hypothetical protein